MALKVYKKTCILIVEYSLQDTKGADNMLIKQSCYLGGEESLIANPNRDKLDKYWQLINTNVNPIVFSTWGKVGDDIH